MQRVSADRLIRDLHAVVADVDELIESTAGNATEAIAKARDRVEASLKAAKQNLECARLCSVEEANTAPQSKEAYFRVNAWKAIGVAGGIGLLLGAIAGLKGRLSRMRRDGPN
jgi:ElaB/YqjD/DUF883 family membrane-anchored ribosome-binding protein